MSKRLSKALAAAGIASRRACEEMIFQGRVRVNGQTVLIPQTQVIWGKDQIEVDGRKIKGEEHKKYFLLNKPVSFICSTEGRKTVYDLFSGLGNCPRIFSVGRLDRDTSGLLLLTNDGHFAHRVMHPSFNVAKEYLAKARQEISPEHLKKASKGIYVQGSFVKPVKVKKVRRSSIKIVVMEGKKHEVREILKAAGLDILELKRIRIGKLILGSLPVGQYRELSQKEIDFFNSKGKAELKQVFDPSYDHDNLDFDAL